VDGEALAPPAHIHGDAVAWPRGACEKNPTTRLISWQHWCVFFCTSRWQRYALLPGLFFSVMPSPVSMTAPAGLLAALQLAVSPNAAYDFYQCPSGTSTSPAIVGKTGRIAVYLVPKDSVLEFRGSKPTAVVGSADSVTLAPSNWAAITTAAGLFFGVSANKVTAIQASSAMTSSTDTGVRFATLADSAALLVVMPSASIFTTSPPHQPRHLFLRRPGVFISRWAWPQ
jgi:hypothetical protein